MEATSSDERKGWLEMLNNLTKKKEEEKEEKPEGWDKGGEMEEREGNFDMTGLDPKLDDFFKQLWFVFGCGWLVLLFDGVLTFFLLFLSSLSPLL